MRLAGTPRPKLCGPSYVPGVSCPCLSCTGTSYIDFVESVGLPGQMAQVDPIVASFCGGAVGVLSALLLVEESNIKKQQKTRCFYCKGTG